MFSGRRGAHQSGEDAVKAWRRPWATRLLSSPKRWRESSPTIAITCPLTKRIRWNCHRLEAQKCLRFVFPDMGEWKYLLCESLHLNSDDLMLRSDVSRFLSTPDAARAASSSEVKRSVYSPGEDEPVFYYCSYGRFTCLHFFLCSYVGPVSVQRLKVMFCIDYCEYGLFLWMGLCLKSIMCVSRQTMWLSASCLLLSTEVLEYHTIYATAA